MIHFAAFLLFCVMVDDLRRPDEDVTTPCDCLQVLYLPANRNLILLLFPREILILDMEIGQALGSFAIEASTPSFNSVVSCRQRDILFFLHDNGSVSLRAVRSPEEVPYQDDEDPDKIISHKMTFELIYDIKCHSDLIRAGRSSRLMGFCVNPVTESELAILRSDGRILLWALAPPSGEDSFFHGENRCKVLPASFQPACKTFDHTENIVLSNILPQMLTFGANSVKDQFWKPRFVLWGMVSGVGHHPVCLKMCPPLTTKNFHSYKPLLAVGKLVLTLVCYSINRNCSVLYFTIYCDSCRLFCKGKVAKKNWAKSFTTYL